MEVGALVVVAAAWISVLARMSLDVLRIRPLPAGRRLQGCAILLATTGILADLFAEVRGWSQTQQRITHILVLPLVLAGLATIVRGLVNKGRGGHPQGRSPV
jgi:hypothetical protein